MPRAALQPQPDERDSVRQGLPAKAVNATIISLDDAPQGYNDFDKGAAKKFIIDPHGMTK